MKIKLSKSQWEQIGKTAGWMKKAISLQPDAEVNNALLIRTDGSVESIFPKNGKNFTLQELQSYVGGYIEILKLDNDMLMVINEEGKLKNLEKNAEATKMYRLDLIVGDAVVCNSEMIE